MQNLTSLEPLGRESKRMVVPYYPAITNRSKQVLKPFEIQLVISIQNTLRNKLCNYKDKPPPSGATGIYCVLCSDCDSVSSFRRSIATRLQEHAAVVSHGKIEKSSVAKHALEQKHRIDMENVCRVKTVIKPYKPDA